MLVCTDCVHSVKLFPKAFTTTTVGSSAVKPEPGEAKLFWKAGAVSSYSGSTAPEPEKCDFGYFQLIL